MQLSNIATAKFSEIKRFARDRGILPQGDLRSRQVWIDAVSVFLQTAEETIATLHEVTDQAKEIAVELAQETIEGAVECLQEIATYDNAVVLSHKIHVTTGITFRFVYRTFIAACLAVIVLGMISRDIYEAVRQWLESETVAELRLLTPEKMVDRVKSKSILWGTRFLGWTRLQIVSFATQCDRARFRVDSARAAMVWHALTLKSRAHTARAALLH